MAEEKKKGGGIGELLAYASASRTWEWVFRRRRSS